MDNSGGVYFRNVGVAGHSYARLRPKEQQLIQEEEGEAVDLTVRCEYKL